MKNNRVVGKLATLFLCFFLFGWSDGIMIFVPIRGYSATMIPSVDCGVIISFCSLWLPDARNLYMIYADCCPLMVSAMVNWGYENIYRVNPALSSLLRGLSQSHLSKITSNKKDPEKIESLNQLCEIENSIIFKSCFLSHRIIPFLSASSLAEAVK